MIRLKASDGEVWIQGPYSDGEIVLLSQGHNDKWAQEEEYLSLEQLAKLRNSEIMKHAIND